MSRTLPRPIGGSGKSLASIVVMKNYLSLRGALCDQAIHSCARGGLDCFVARAPRNDGCMSFRQRNELVLVWDMGKAAGLPVLLGLLDPLPAGGHKIPPDMARALQRVAAEEHHPRRGVRLDGNSVAGPEDQEPRPLVAFMRDLDLAVDHIDRALLVIGIQRRRHALLQRHLGIKPRRYHIDR